MMKRVGMTTMAVAALLVAACGGDQTDELRPDSPRELADAVIHYRAVRVDVVNALSTSVPEVVWQDKPDTTMTGQPDGTCVLFLPDALSHDDLYGASAELTELADVLDPALEPHGFGALSEVTYPEHGGDAYVEATDPTGWELRVSAQPALVRLNGPVDSPGCDDADLPD